MLQHIIARCRVHENGGDMSGNELRVITPDYRQLIATRRFEPEDRTSARAHADTHARLRAHTHTHTHIHRDARARAHTHARTPAHARANANPHRFEAEERVTSTPLQLLLRGSMVNPRSILKYPQLRRCIGSCEAQS